MGGGGGGLNKPCILLIIISGVERFAFKGVASNLVTYLTDVIEMKNSSAAKFVNSWVGFTSMLPLIVSMLADSYCDKYSTILASSLLYAAVGSILRLFFHISCLLSGDYTCIP
ncbi:hypothetical protein SASPL_142121 [Salvia splendens]|uniref:Solute carrier family 15 (Peptide/histidine transporter), member 3/4 n=1 Tax=Salvia splendens TaxID=180675 RepID=A0A8X8Z967_SALSN|nr:hypothetical protein SASPL_142121 [Salvia splendens]